MDVKLDGISNLNIPINISEASNKELTDRISAYMNANGEIFIQKQEALIEIKQIKAHIEEQMNSKIFKWLGDYNYFFSDLKKAHSLMQNLNKKANAIDYFKKFGSFVNEELIINEHAKNKYFEDEIAKKTNQLEDQIPPKRLRSIFKDEYNLKIQGMDRIFRAFELAKYCEAYSDLIFIKNKKKSHEYLEKSVEYFKLILKLLYDKQPREDYKFISDAVAEYLFKLEVRYLDQERAQFEELKNFKGSIAELKFQLAENYAKLAGINDPEKNIARARKFYKDASEEGHAKAMLYYAGMCENGFGGPKDLNEAREIYEELIYPSNDKTFNDTIDETIIKEATEQINKLS